MHDRVACPYCGKSGTVIRVFADGSIDVSHASEERDVISSATGKPIRCGVFLDGCSKYGKLGLAGRNEPIGFSEIEEDLPPIEEDL